MGSIEYNSIVLQFQLQQKLRQLREDDKAIALEGVDSLSFAECQSACEQRGIVWRSTEEDCRRNLSEWIDLSVRKGVPSIVLLVARAVTYHEVVGSDAFAVVADSQPGPASVEQQIEEIEKERSLIEEEKKNPVLAKATREAERLAKLREMLIKVSDGLETLSGKPLGEEEDELYSLRKATRAVDLNSISLVDTETAKVASMLSKRVSSLTQSLENELHDVEGELKTFKLIDQDNDGVISRDELKKCFELMKLELSAEDAEALMKMIDFDNDGSVSIAEFANYVKNELKE
jgi:hypothetical protein